ncbi:MAG: SulP family inorganic anion transporter [Bdellovibrionota bacterium]
MNKDRIFYPKLFTTLSDYSWGLFRQDATAGLIVGIVALPLAVAFAIASGVTPERGLATAIVGGFLISALGGSRVQIGGPTGAFVVIVYRIVQVHGVEGCLIACMMAGLMLIALGAMRFGTVIRYIPYPLVVGFTSGIAVVIFSSQIKDFFGLDLSSLPADFLSKWWEYVLHFHSMDWPTTMLSVFSLGVVWFWPKWNRRVPGSVVAILVSTFLVQMFDIPVETIGSRFGALPTQLTFSFLPEVTLTQIKTLIPSAITIALLGAIESLLSATVADGMIEGKHRSNTELVAQGIANVVVPFFGGIPATGAIARTATNIKNGAKTPISGMVHSLVLLVFVYVIGQWIAWVPISTLAAILIVVSYNMSEAHAFRALLKAPKMDVVVLMVTFFLTLLVDLTVAVQIGFLLSVLLFMKRMIDVSSIREITDQISAADTEEELRSDQDATTNKVVPRGVVIYEAEGAFFFGVAEMFRTTLDLGKNPPKALILRMRHVLALDATGLKALEDLHSKCQKEKVRLVLSGIHAQPYMAIKRSGLIETLGGQNIHYTLDEAIASVSVELQNAS